MTRRLSYSPGVIDQVIAEADYVRSQGQPAAGEKLITNFFDLCQTLRDTPGIGHPFQSSNPACRGIQQIAINGFRVLIYYRVTEDAIQLMAAVHGSRDQTTVEDRLE